MGPVLSRGCEVSDEILSGLKLKLPFVFYVYLKNFEWKGSHFHFWHPCLLTYFKDRQWLNLTFTGSLSSCIHVTFANIYLQGTSLNNSDLIFIS